MGTLITIGSYLTSHISTPLSGSQVGRLHSGVTGGAGEGCSVGTVSMTGYIKMESSGVGVGGSEIDHPLLFIRRDKE